MAAASAWSRTRESSLVLGMPMQSGLSSPGALALHCRSDSMFLVKSSAEKSASLQPPAFCVEQGHGDGPVARTRG